MKVSLHIFDVPVEVEKKLYFWDIKFKNTCPANMKVYIEFLCYHHGYSAEKLLSTFPEYIYN